MDHKFRFDLGECDISQIYYNQKTETILIDEPDKVFILNIKTQEFFVQKVVTKEKKLFHVFSSSIFLYEKEDGKIFSFNLETFKEEETQNELIKIMKETDDYRVKMSIDPKGEFFLSRYNQKDVDKKRRLVKESE